MRAEIIEIRWITDHKVGPDFDGSCLNPSSEANMTYCFGIKTIARRIDLPMDFTNGSR
jgi:hypothetical protein